MSLVFNIFKLITRSFKVQITPFFYVPTNEGGFRKRCLERWRTSPLSNLVVNKSEQSYLKSICWWTWYDLQRGNKLYNQYNRKQTTYWEKRRLVEHKTNHAHLFVLKDRSCRPTFNFHVANLIANASRKLGYAIGLAFAV